MAPIAALGSDTDPAGRQGKVVGNYKEILDGDIECLEPIADSLAAQVHIGIGLQEVEDLVLGPYLGDIAKPVRFKRSVGFLCQGIQHQETDIVAGVYVFRARITEPGYKILHRLSAL